LEKGKKGKKNKMKKDKITSKKKTQQRIGLSGELEWR